MNMTYNLPGAKDLILTGKKIHSIRADAVNRWQAGRMIHHCTKSCSADRDGFLVNKCISTQQILLVHITDPNPSGVIVKVTIDRRRLSPMELNDLAINDGFPGVKEMAEYFFGNGESLFGGKIIHWTDLKY